MSAVQDFHQEFSEPPKSSVGLQKYHASSYSVSTGEIYARSYGQLKIVFLIFIPYFVGRRRIIQIDANNGDETS